MKITNLGHTECLVECTLKNGESFRFLLDSWLSNYSVADLMERSQTVTIDWAKLPKIDVVYLSHSHLDHIDPYFLTELYQYQNPVLLLAETLEYLIPVFKKYLPETAVIQLQKHLETTIWKEEVEITGLSFCTDSIGNEEDVVTLFISHGNTAAYFEIDTLPPMIYEEQELLVSLLTAKKYDAIAYVASSNELEGNLAIFDYKTKKSRDAFVRKHIQERMEAIEESYDITYEHELPLHILSKLPVHTVIIGQGLRFPVEISESLAKARFLELREVASIHAKAAKLAGGTRTFSALEGGETLIVGKAEVAQFEKDAQNIHKISPKFLQTSANIPGLSISPKIPANLENFTCIHRLGIPLNRKRDTSFESLEKSILEVLNTRFLPTKFADPNDNLKQLLLTRNERSYRIEVLYGNTSPFESRMYVWNFGLLGFQREIILNNTISTGTSNSPDEKYFANDLADFLDGTQELYCNFFHKLDPNMQYRLWTVLGANFINHDLVNKKVILHFERAKNNENAEGFVKGVIDGCFEVSE